MTIVHARVLAIAVSLAYLPAYISGFVAVWVIGMVAAVVLHFGIQIKQLQYEVEWDTLAQASLAPISRRLYVILFANAFIPTAGIALAAVLQVAMSSFPSTLVAASALDASVFDVVASLIGASEAYDGLPMSERMALHMCVLGACLMVALIAVKSQALYPLMSRVHCVRAKDQDTLDGRFSVYLHYKFRVSIEFSLLSFYFIMYAIALNHFIGSQVTSGVIFWLLCIFAPPILFIEGFYFLVRTAVYFRHC